MTITNFDKPTLRKLRDDLQAAVAAVASQHGININVGNARFDSTTVTFKLNCVTLGSDGVAQTKESKDLATWYPQYVGKSVTLRGRGKTLAGTVVGYKSRGRKYPFLVEASDGKTYKVDENCVR